VAVMPNWQAHTDNFPQSCYECIYRDSYCWLHFHIALALSVLSPNHGCPEGLLSSEHSYISVGFQLPCIWPCWTPANWIHQCLHTCI